MEQFVGRIQRMRQQLPGFRLRDMSDALLLKLLSQSEGLFDRVNSNTILFKKGDPVNYWYLLLSGEVELFLPPGQSHDFPSTSAAVMNGSPVIEPSAIRLRTLDSGAIFGELNLQSHSCSARVQKPSEFVRIPQSHFVHLYSEYADHLQPFIMVMEDFVSEHISMLLFPTDQATVSTPRSKKSRPQLLMPARNSPSKGDPYNLSSIRRELPSIQETRRHRRNMMDSGECTLVDYDSFQYADESPPHLVAVNYAPAEANLFELNSSIALESRVFEAALALKRTMQLGSSHMIAERHSQHRLDCFEAHRDAIIGSEMTQWLGDLAQQVFASTPPHTLKPLSSLQLVGMWQTLLDFNYVSHVKHEQNFKDKHVFYRWAVEDPLEDLYRSRMQEQNPGLLQNGYAAISSLQADSDLMPSLADLQNAIFLLSTLGLDSLFRVILNKAPYERSVAEIDLVFEELLHIKALSHLSTMVKRELASVIRFEQHQHAGTVLFHQGEMGESWYIILKGSVDVSVHGKGVVCTLHEGDDFGKLALVNSAPRAATIALAEDNAQFLRVDRNDFDRILNDVEENTVRLKEHGHDVLVLERIPQPQPSAHFLSCRHPPNGVIADTSNCNNKNQFCYSVMAGLPEKMVEYILETRIDTVTIEYSYPKDGSPDSSDSGSDFGPILVSELDTFLEDFVLTHIIFMPSNLLCNYLKNYYNRRGFNTVGQEIGQNGCMPNGFASNGLGSDFDFTEQLLAKKRVVVFLAVWQFVLGIHFFLDSVANSFVEEMYCCVLEDAKMIPRMMPIVEQISHLRQLRENAMRVLTRHPTLILDCGVYSAQAPAPNPVLPIDICNQCIYLSDTTYITMHISLDKPTTEIVALARARVRQHRSQMHTSLKPAMNGMANGFHSSRHFPEVGVSRENGVESMGEDMPESEDEECFLIEVKSNGERVVYAPTEVSVPTMLSLNGKLYVVFKEEIDSLLPLPDQDGPMEPSYHSVFDLLDAQELAQQLFAFHTQLFEATDEMELIIQVIGRDQFPGRMPSNLDLLLRRFNEVQYWASTEVLLANNTAKRLQVLKKLIKVALYAKEHKDLMSLFAITLGLSNVAVSRLSHFWMKLSAKLRRQYAEFEALLDPSRNHRAYRLLVAKMRPPVVPFVPLLLKDLTFMHEGNKTSFAGLINFEKMQMMANVLKNFRNCKANRHTAGILSRTPLSKKNTQSLIRNFRVIDNQRRLMELSHRIEPSTNPSHIANKTNHYV